MLFIQTMMRNINRLNFGKSGVLFWVKAGGMYSNHCTLKGENCSVNFDDKLLSACQMSAKTCPALVFL
jgi:hypothetical protein